MTEPSDQDQVPSFPPQHHGPFAPPSPFLNSRLHNPAYRRCSSCSRTPQTISPFTQFLRHFFPSRYRFFLLIFADLYRIIIAEVCTTMFSLLALNKYCHRPSQTPALFILSLFSWSHFSIGSIPSSTPPTPFISITFPFSLSLLRFQHFLFINWLLSFCWFRLSVSFFLIIFFGP